MGLLQGVVKHLNKYENTFSSQSLEIVIKAGEVQKIVTKHLKSGWNK